MGHPQFPLSDFFRILESPDLPNSDFFYAINGANSG